MQSFISLDSDLEKLKKQYASEIFSKDRKRLSDDLRIIYDGALASTIFSWWCVDLVDCNFAGQYHISLEDLYTAYHLMSDQRAPSRAKEILLEQAEMSKWVEKGYGDMSHDLSSSHHCRGFAFGLNLAWGELDESEKELVKASYIKKIREPYLASCFENNPYLVGNRNTNWLAHLSGSVLLAELSWAVFGLEDKALMALAKANVLRYLEFINRDGSSPEMGDYYFYGMEFALLSLHAWQLRYKKDILQAKGDAGIRESLKWYMSFADEDGFYWGDFGDTHTGYHVASRVVGYLYGYYFDAGYGQLLGDANESREPLAAFLRKDSLVAKPYKNKINWFKQEDAISVKNGLAQLGLKGGLCRSPVNSMPHRHYDAGSIIYRVDKKSLIVDSGLYRYLDDFWDNFDEPNHQRSSSLYHNLLFVNDRLYHFEDCIDSEIVSVVDSGEVQVIHWRLKTALPDLKSWSRYFLLSAKGLIVLDKVDATLGADVSVYWHLHEMPKSIEKNQMQTSLFSGKAASNNAMLSEAQNDHPAPYWKLKIKNEIANHDLLILSVFGETGVSMEEIDWSSNKICFSGFAFDWSTGLLKNTEV